MDVINYLHRNVPQDCTTTNREHVQKRGGKKKHNKTDKADGVSEVRWQTNIHAE